MTDGDAGGNNDLHGNPPTESLATATLAALVATMAVLRIQMAGVQEAVKDNLLRTEWLANHLVPQQCHYTGMVMRIRSETQSASIVDATEDTFGTAEKYDLVSDGRQTARRSRQRPSCEQCVLSSCPDADTYVAHHRPAKFSATSEQQQSPGSSAQIPPTTCTLTYLNEPSSTVTSTLPHFQPIAAQLSRHCGRPDRSQANLCSHASHAASVGINRLSADRFVVDNFCREELKVNNCNTGSQPLPETVRLSSSVMKRKRDPVASSSGRCPNRDDDRDHDRQRKPSPLRKPSPESGTYYFPTTSMQEVPGQGYSQPQVSLC